MENLVCQVIKDFLHWADDRVEYGYPETPLENKKRQPVKKGYDSEPSPCFPQKSPKTKITKVAPDEKFSLILSSGSDT